MQPLLERSLAAVLPLAVVIAVLLSRAVERGGFFLRTHAPVLATAGSAPLDEAVLARVLGLPPTRTLAPMKAELSSARSSTWRLVGTLVSTRAEWSLAAVENAEEKPPRVSVIRVGQELAELTVVAIERERVLVLHDGQFEDIDVTGPSTSASVASVAPEGPFHALGSGQFAMSRVQLQRIVDDVPSISRQARFELADDHGKMVGFRLSWFQPGSLFEQMGLARGDVITRVNGFEMSSPERAFELYAKLRESSRVDVEVLRGGALSHRTFAIR